MARETITPRPFDIGAVSVMSPEQRAEYREKLLAPCPLDGKAGHIWTRGQGGRWRCAGCTLRPFVADDPERRVLEVLAALDAVAQLEAHPGPVASA